MKILVCIKQVPGSNNVEVDEKTGVLKREGVESKMNPYDLYAIETALWIKELTSCSVDVVTMGPPQAETVVREAFMMGVDGGYLFSDRKFAGADVLATSYTLSQGIQSIGHFDLIICGRQTTDGDTAQVGPALAEFLSIPHVTWVKSIKDVTADEIVVEQDLSDSVELAVLKYPCLITVEKDIRQPRLPSYKKKLETENRVIHILHFDDFINKDENKYGLNGSPTQVERIFPPEVNSVRVILEGKPEDLVEKVIDKLKEIKYI